LFPSSKGGAFPWSKNSEYKNNISLLCTKEIALRIIKDL